MSSIRLTTFTVEPKFKKAVRSFGPSSAAVVLNDIEQFERDWCDGMEDDQLFAQYNFKRLKDVDRPYELFQIRAGPNRRNLSYHAIVMYCNGQSYSHWVHAFKKENMNEPQEIKLAIARADEVWNTCKGRH